MSITEIFLLALGVSLDSLALAICKGINSKNTFKLALKCTFCFSFFQLFMPILGYYLGQAFEKYIDSFDHYIVFGVLLIFGINMFKEAFSKDTTEEKTGLISLLLLAFFSSFDSLGVGITLALFDANIIISCSFIFVLTLIFSFVGIYLGKFFGKKNKKIACILGGIILIALAIKILISNI